MPRTYKRKNNSRTYPSKALVKQAIEAVENGMGLKTASKNFNIPRSTLRRRILNRGEIKPVGGQLIFTEKQEAVFRDRLLYLSERGFPCTIDEIRTAAYLYAKKLQRKQKLNKKYPNSLKKLV